VYDTLTVTKTGPEDGTDIDRSTICWKWYSVDEEYDKYYKNFL
jgi:hypothetical protein